MKNFKEKLLSLVDIGASRATDLFDTMNETINSIDWDAQFGSLMEMKDSLMEKGNELLSEFNELMKRVKDNIVDFEVIVPFDESLGETFECHVTDNKLEIVVSFKDENVERSNKTSVNIPKNCDIEKMSKKYNALNKTMTVIIPKIVAEPKKEEKTEEKVEDPKGFKLSNMVTPKKPTKKATEEEPHEAESKLLKKFHEHAKKGARVAKVESETPTTPRGANGRFIKRTV